MARESGFNYDIEHCIPEDERVSRTSESAGSVDVTLILSCGTSECPNHGSHEPNIGGSSACMAMTGRCSKWTKPNVKRDPRGT